MGFQLVRQNDLHASDRRRRVPRSDRRLLWAGCPIDLSPTRSSRASFWGSGPDHGVLVRQIPLLDLWPPEHIPGMINDHTPLWFASGTFAFSPNNRTLIHKTRWGKTLEISLETGQVMGQ